MSDNVESLMGNGSFWLPGSYSTMSNEVDQLFNGIYWLSFIGTLLITAVTLYFTFKYLRKRKDQKASYQLTESHTLEIAWSVIPFFILMFLFYLGFQGYLKLFVAPENTLDFRVHAKKWVWVFEDPRTGQKSINELVVPKGQPVKLIMSSEDVLHSFFVPNFRVKKDVIPNKYSNLWFEATKVGTFQIFCTEFCGDGHSDMLATLTVLEQDDYERHLKESGMPDDMPLVELGAKLYKSKGCNACHSVDGSSKIGPTWLKAYGTQRSLEDGSSVAYDDNYVRESVVNPGAKIAKGYQNVMPSYSGLLNDREQNAIIEYIKSLK